MVSAWCARRPRPRASVRRWRRSRRNGPGGGVPRRGRGGKYWFDGDGDRVIVPRCHTELHLRPHRVWHIQQRGGEAAWVNARRSASHPGSTRITSGDRVARAGHLIQTNHGRRWPRGDHFGSDRCVVGRPSRTWDRGCGVDLELILAFEQRRELSMRNDLDGSLNQPDDHQQNEKNGGRLAICAVRPANRSKKVVLGVRDRMGATDSGPHRHRSTRSAVA